MRSFPSHNNVHKKIKPPLVNKDDIKTWYHLDSRRCTSHTGGSAFPRPHWGAKMTTLNALTGVPGCGSNLHRANSEAMFGSFQRTRSHQPGFSERFPLLTLLFTAFIHYIGYYISDAGVLSTGTIILFLSSSATAPPPRHKSRRPAFRQSWPAAPGAQILPRSPGDRRIQRPPIRQRRC